MCVAARPRKGDGKRPTSVVREDSGEPAIWPYLYL